MQRVWLVVLAWCVGLAAQEPPLTVNATVTPTECAVGESVSYEATITARNGQVGPFEPTPPDFAGLDATAAGEPERLDTPDAVVYTYRYRLTPSQTGELLIAPFSVIWQDPVDGRRRAEASPRIALRVRPVDDEEDIRGPKPPVVVPDRTLVWVLGISGAALLLALVSAARRRRRRPPRLAPPPAAPVAPPPPRPEDVALARLAELAAADLPAQGLVDAYHIRLSHIVRAYLADAFDVPAEVSTTTEIAWRLEDCAVPAEEIALCRQVLYGCDLEKFAAYQPSAVEMGGLLDQARSLVTALARRHGGQP